MNNFFTWMAVVIVVLLCALFAVPPLIDWNQYRGVFEEEASRILGREVRVGGKVDLRLLPVPFVQFEKISIADARGIPGSFVRAENFTLLLSVPPLLSGVIEARKLQIDKPVLRLQFDKEGRGNWRKINLSAQDFPFIPADFALQSAEINDGQIVVESHRGQVIAQIAGLSGELAAATLRGPYRFNGDAVIGDARLNIRLVTGLADETGVFSVTATATNEESGARNYIEGRLSDLQTVPKFSGEFSVRAPLALFASAGAATPNYDLRSKVSFDHRAAQLSDLEIAIDSMERPQQLQGHLQADWTEDLAISGRLQSSWLDIDAIAGGKTRNAAYRVFEILADNITLGTKSTGSSRIDLSVQQANVAGQTVREISARLSRNNGELNLERLSANLPGMAKLRMDGRFLNGTANKYDWQGHTFIRGDNFKRFFEWLWPSAGVVAGTADRDFELSGAIRFSPQELEFSNANVTLAGHSSEGLLRYNWMQKPILTLDWTADIVDLSGFGDNILSNQNLSSLLGLTGAAPGEEKLSQISQILRSANFDVRLQAQKINDASRTLSGVNLVLFRTDRKLQFGKSSLVVEPGLSVQFEGDLELLSAGSDTGNWDLKGLVSAASERAIKELSDFTQHVAPGFQVPREVHEASPLDVTFYSTSDVIAGKRKNTLEVDGSMRTDRLQLSLVTEGQLGSWRENRLTLNVKLDGKSTQSVAKLLRSSNGGQTQRPAHAMADEISSAAEDQPFYLRFNLHGVPERHLKASAALVSQPWQLRIEADGKSETDGKSLDWTGVGNAQINDLKSILVSIEPRSARLFPASISSGGQFEFTGLQNGWQLEPADFQFAGSQISGEVKLVYAKLPRARPSLTGSITVDRIDGFKLAQAILLDEEQPPALDAKATENTDAQVQPVKPVKVEQFWPTQAFDLTALDLLDVDLRVSAARVALAPGLDLQKAQMNIASTSKKIALKILDGELLGGKASGALEIGSASFGTAVKTEIEIADARIAALISSDLSARAAGRVDFNLAAEGSALNPQALLTILKGTGTAKLRDVQVPGLPPASLTEIADSIVIGESRPEEFAERVGEALAAGSLKLADRHVPLTLAGGKLSIGSLSGDEKMSGLTDTTTVDMIDFAVDSQWQIETILQRSKEEPGFVPKPLPSAQIIYAGTLAKLNEIEATLNLGDIQRELTVQRTEYDVSRLERLRREDEERARQQEAEHRRQQELKRQKAEEEARKRAEGARQLTEGQKTSPIAADPRPSSDPGRTSATVTIQQEPLPPPNNLSQTNPTITPAPLPEQPPPVLSAPPVQKWNPFQSEN